jgi:hypothetical protein
MDFPDLAPHFLANEAVLAMALGHGAHACIYAEHKFIFAEATAESRVVLFDGRFRSQNPG